MESYALRQKWELYGVYNKTKKKLIKHMEITVMGQAAKQTRAAERGQWSEHTVGMKTK